VISNTERISWVNGCEAVPGNPDVGDCVIKMRVDLTFQVENVKV